MEASGHARWFERLLAELQFELWVGDAAEIRRKRGRKQKTDRQDAQHILGLLLKNDFPPIWVPSWENRDLRQLLWHRHRMVQARTRIMNQLQAVALNEGLLCKKRLWREPMPEKTNENGTSQESKDLVVFDIVRNSECAECRKELLAHDFLFMEDGRPLCLTCADLDHLGYLPRGDTALTRRARKYSSLSAVVVRFSRARKRYERQGVLVEEAALERAAEECHADASKRLGDREKASLRRAEQDRDLALRMTESILALYPGCPPAEAQAIAVHTSRRSSGRVGRSAAGRALEAEALNAAVVAAIRHRHTRYDQLLMHGYSRRDARDAVYEAINHLLERWRTHR